MSYTIGFDFGTHQTKICIEDSSNPFEKMYEFIAFEKLDRTTTVLFPSIVQINNDDTLSYGFVDDDKCKMFRHMDKKPVLILLDYPPVVGKPRKPIPQYPPRPQKSWQRKDDLDKWKKKCSELEKEIDLKWKEECNGLEREYLFKVEQIKRENERRKRIYESEMNEWKNGRMLRFRYFKLKAFTEEGLWNYPNFSAKEITVWYITYVLLILKRKYGDDFSIQFGVPVGGNGQKDEDVINNAYSLYIAAWDLSEKFSSLEEYKSSSYMRLRKLTNIRKKLTEEEKNEYIFDHISEAFAGLVSITQQRKLGIGFHILADIGGGTTDMALFYVKTKSFEPVIIYTYSFAQGLNYIFEKAKEKFGSYSIEELQNEFFYDSNSDLFKNAIQEYESIFKEAVRSMINILRKSFDDSRDKHKLSFKQFNEAINKQPIIYCGGGSLYSDLHFIVEPFTDRKYIDKEILNIRNLKNEKQIDGKIYPILATSYGLASYGKIRDEVFTNVDNVFNHLTRDIFANNTKDYGIDDT